MFTIFVTATTEPTDDRQITICRPTVGRLSADNCPTVSRQLLYSRPTTARQTANSQPTVGYLSVILHAAYVETFSLSETTL